MSEDGQVHIRLHHQGRSAIVYVRTTRIPGPTDYAGVKAQYEQVRHAHAWGWPEGAIDIIDDLGRSGNAAEGREGFQQLCGMVSTGSVGLVLVAGLSRIARSPAILMQFLDLCRQQGTLVAANGILVDVSTMVWRESSPRQTGRNTGSAAYPQKIRESFRHAADGKSIAEIAEKLNHGKLKTARTESRQ